MKSLDIIIEIRRQAAVIRAMINYLAGLKLVGTEQSYIIERARINFNKILAINIAELRKVYGDEEYLKLGEPDKQPKYDPASWGYLPKTVVETIKKETSKFLKVLLNIPGENGATDIQSMIIDNLWKAARDWQNYELGELINVFK